jgi:hypothetical protein
MTEAGLPLHKYALLLLRPNPTAQQPMSFQTETFSISQPGPSGVPATNTTIIYQYTDWFRGSYFAHQR